MERALAAIIAGHPALALRTDLGGPVIEIATSQAKASIALQGAHVISWQPQGTSEVLWCSPLSRLDTGKAIRGGIPVCWPWFGIHASDATLPQHGYARTAMWTLEPVQPASTRADGAMALRFHLPPEQHPKSMCNGPATVSLLVEVGHTLKLTLETVNTGTTPVVITEALHTYFAVGDVKRISINGLDGAIYRDNADGGRSKTQSGDLEIAQETIALFDAAGDSCTLHDPILKRRIAIARTGTRSTIVWNPHANAARMADIPSGAERAFVCIESGAIGEAAVTISPGAKHALGVTYSIEPM
jgi:glucose-6-phosphate 1-epimerase